MFGIILKEQISCFFFSITSNHLGNAAGWAGVVGVIEKIQNERIMDVKDDGKIKHFTGTEGDFSDIVHIPHHPSPNFVSDFATGAMLTSSGIVDNLFYLTFFTDLVSVTHEVATKLDSERDDMDKKRTIPGYNLSITPDCVNNIREDKARIALSGAALRSVRDLLNNVKFEDEN